MKTTKILKNQRRIKRKRLIDSPIEVPTFAEEEKLETQGYKYIAGLDEVGRGCLAGPVYAAAVILPLHIEAPWVDEVRDSKKLTAIKREKLAEKIKKAAIAYGIGWSEYDVIDSAGIVKAVQLAMKSAIAKLNPQAETLLLDYFYLPGANLPQKGVIHGDSVCFSIACASIIAKVARDRVMVELDKQYPGYGLAEHKGYSTAKHLACLKKLGPSPIHRRSYAPVGEAAKV